jgi:hypothetical protein
MKGEYDVFVRKAGFKQGIRDRAIRPVILNPNLAVNNVQMNDRTVHTTLALPTCMHDFIMINIRIEYAPNASCKSSTGEGLRKLLISIASLSPFFSAASVSPSAPKST